MLLLGSVLQLSCSAGPVPSDQREIHVNAFAPDGGGIHIAPLIGTAKGAGDHYRLEWLQTGEGFAVDALEPAVFAALAIMALCRLPFDPGRPAAAAG